MYQIMRVQKVQKGGRSSLPRSALEYKGAVSLDTPWNIKGGSLPRSALEYKGVSLPRSAPKDKGGSLPGSARAVVRLLACLAVACLLTCLLTCLAVTCLAVTCLLTYLAVVIVLLGSGCIDRSEHLTRLYYVPVRSWYISWSRSWQNLVRRGRVPRDFRSRLDGVARVTLNA